MARPAVDPAERSAGRLVVHAKLRRRLHPGAPPSCRRDLIWSSVNDGWGNAMPQRWRTADTARPAQTGQVERQMPSFSDRSMLDTGIPACCRLKGMGRGSAGDE
jgi:hypothetical protein